MKRAIVTGANGFIGKYVTAELVKNNYSVIAVTHSNPTNVIEGAEYVTTDLNNITDLENSLSKADVLFHFAWEGSSGEKRSNLEIQINNVMMTNNLVKLSKKLNSRFIGAGSIMENEVYSANILNDCNPDNNTIYAAAKYFAHLTSKKMAYSLNVEHVWGIITNTFGPGEINPRLINTTIKKIIDNKPIEFTSGEQTYDFIYITDLAKIFRLLGEKGKDQHQYVIGSGNPQPLRSYLELMDETINGCKKFEYGKIKFNGISLTKKDYDITKTIEDLNYRPEKSFQDGIEETYTWYRNHYEANGNNKN